MDEAQGSCGRVRGPAFPKPAFSKVPGRASARIGGVVALVLAGAGPAVVHAQQSVTAAPSLVFDGVTVVDVEQGKLVPTQRVVITGNRIQAMGDAGAVKVPKDAQVVDARGKYLIPGLWDLHVHPRALAYLFYPLFIANGVIGIRDAWSEVPLDTLRQWRRRSWPARALVPRASS